MLVNPVKFPILVCTRCGNKWTYKGRSTYYASCSTCKTSVRIKNKTTRPRIKVGHPLSKVE